MAQTSDELKRDIERTREEMGDTVEALAYKADVPTRTKEWLGDKKDAVVSKVSGASSKVGEATPDGQQVKEQAGRFKQVAERNPLGLAIGGAAAGFLAGLLTPSTRLEDERLGPIADEVKSSAAEAGREALDRGRLVAQEAGESALETAKESGREQKEELAASLQDKAREVVPGQEPTESPPPTGSSKSR
jgi:Protein of unknown function (DUF3618)